MRKRISVLLIILFLCSISLVSASDDGGTCPVNIQDDGQAAITNDVEASNPDENILCSDEDVESFESQDDGSFSELQSLIYQTPVNGVINLNKSYSYKDDDSLSYISISKSITINGNNHTINANNIQNIFRITYGSVVLNNITFKNTNNTFHSIYVYSGYCLINNSNFIDNNATGTIVYGGNGVCDIYNSYFENNYAGWGVVYYYPKAGNIVNCSFYKNRGVSAYYCGEGSIINSKFINNSKRSFYSSAYRKNVNVVNCSFLDNNLNSPVFYIGDGYVSLKGCYFKNNVLDGYTAIIYNSDDLYVDNSTFENNQGYNGGVIYSYGYRNTVEISNSVFNNNVASNAGGVLYISEAVSVLFFNNTMENNTAKYENNIFNTFSSYYDSFVIGLNLTVLDNMTVYSNDLVEVQVTLTDDMGNSISGPAVTIQLNGEDKFTKTFVDGKATVQLSASKIGENIISAYLNGAYGGIALRTATIISTVEPYIGPIYVSTDGNDSNNGDKNHPLKSIQKAVDLASINSKEVIITEGVYKEHDINITSGEVAITGEGNVVIDACELGRAFIITKNATLSNLRIINCKSFSNVQYTNMDISNYLDSNFLDFNLNREGLGGAVYAPTYDSTIIFKNVIFENNKANFGGAIFVGPYDWYQKSNLSVIDCEFLNNTAYQCGGAIYSFTGLFTVNNSKFTNNQAIKLLSSQGGAIYSYYLTLLNSTFDNNMAAFGGAVYSQRLTVNDSYFSHNNASFGGAIYSKYIYLFGNTIVNSSGVQDSGLFITGYINCVQITILDNKTIETTSSNYEVYATLTDDMGNPISGGYIYFTINGIEVLCLPFNNGFVNTTLSLSEGENNISADLCYVDAYIDLTMIFYEPGVTNTATVISNTQPYTGPIYVSVDGDDSAVGDENHPLKSLTKAIDLATNDGGSKQVIMKEGTYYLHDIEIYKDVQISGQGNVVIDAEGKGRIFKFDTQYQFFWWVQSADLKLSNLTLMNGNASKVSSYERTYLDYLFGADDIFQIDEDIGFGGAIYSNSPLILDNITFINNYANMGGAAFVKNLEANNTKFINNSAIDYPNGVYNPSEYYYDWDKRHVDEGFEKLNLIRLSDYDSGNFWVRMTIPFSLDDYMVFSTQELADYISYGYITNVLNFYKNNFNGEDVIEYLKILMFNHRNETFKLQKAIWIFTDGQYWNSTHPWIVETINQYNSGNLIPDKGNITLSNGTVVEYDFKGIYSPSDDFFYYVYPDKELLRTGHTPTDNEQSNFIMIQYSQTDNNITVDKETLNKTVKVNEIVEFLITITNTGNTTISTAFIEDSDYSSDLEYISWISQKGSWTFNQNQMRWYLNDNLTSADSASIIVLFKVLNAGVLINNATAGFNNVTVANSTNTTNGTIENITVTKETLNETVKVNQTVEFLITITNTGTVVISTAFIEDSDYSSDLEYINWKTQVGNWTFNQNQMRWYLDGDLAPGESASLIVIFKALNTGVLRNNVTAGFNNVTVANSTNTTNGTIENITVTKETLNETVKVNQTVEFLITITNTGTVVISTAFIEDSDYSSDLEYINWKTQVGNWTFNRDEMRWYLDGDLAPGESASLIVMFKALASGILRNNVTAGFNNVTVANSTNTTNVTEDLDNNTDDIKTFPYTPITWPPVTYTPLTEKNETNYSSDISKATGNPVFMLFFVLLALPVLRRKF